MNRMVSVKVPSATVDGLAGGDELRLVLGDADRDLLAGSA